MDKKMDKEIENSELNEELNQEDLDEVAGGKGELKKGSAALMSSLMLLSGAPGLSAYDNKAKTGSTQTTSESNSNPNETEKSNTLKEKFQKIFTKENLKKYGISAGLIGGSAASAAKLYKTLMSDPKFANSQYKFNDLPDTAFMKKVQTLEISEMIRKTFDKYREFTVVECIYILICSTNPKFSNLTFRKDQIAPGVEKLRSLLISFVGDNQELRNKTEKILDLKVRAIPKVGYTTAEGSYDMKYDYEFISLLPLLIEAYNGYNLQKKQLVRSYNDELSEYIHHLKKLDLSKIKTQELKKELNQEDLDEVAGGKGELKKGSAALMSSLMLLSGAPGLSAYDNKARTGSMQTISANNSTSAKPGKLDALKEKFQEKFKNILSKEKLQEIFKKENLQKIFTKENLKKYGIPAGMIGGGAVSAAALYKILMNNPKLLISSEDKSVDIKTILEAYPNYTVADCIYICSSLLRTKDSNLELKKNIMPSGTNELRSTIISFVEDNQNLRNKQDLRNKTEKILNLKSRKALELINKYEKYGNYQLHFLINDMVKLYTNYQPGSVRQSPEYQGIYLFYPGNLEDFDLNMIEKPAEAEKIAKEKHEANLARMKKEREYISHKNPDDDNNIEVFEGRKDLTLSDKTFDRPMGCVEIENVLQKYQDFTIAECAYIYHNFKYADKESVELTLDQITGQANELCERITKLAKGEIELNNDIKPADKGLKTTELENKIETIMNLKAGKAYDIITKYKNGTGSSLRTLIGQMEICYTGFEFNGFQSSCLWRIEKLDLNEINNPKPVKEPEKKNDEVVPEKEREKDGGGEFNSESESEYDESESDESEYEESEYEDDEYEYDKSKIVFSTRELRNREMCDLIREIIKKYPDHTIDEYVYIYSAILRAAKENPGNPILKLEKNLVTEGAKDVHNVLVSSLLDPQFKKTADKMLSSKVEEACSMYRYKDNESFIYDRLISEIAHMINFYNCPNKNRSEERDNYVLCSWYFRYNGKDENLEDEEAEGEKFEFSYDTFGKKLCLVKPKDILEKYPDFTLVECAHIRNILDSHSFDDDSPVTLTRNQIAKGAESLRHILNSILDMFNPELKDKANKLMDLKAKETYRIKDTREIYPICGLIQSMAYCDKEPESRRFQDYYIKELEKVKLNWLDNTNFAEEHPEEEKNLGGGYDSDSEEENKEEEKEKYPDSEPENEPENEPESEPESEPENEAENEPENEPENEAENEPENEPENEAENEPENDSDDNSDDESEDDSDDNSDEDKKWRIQSEKINNAVESIQQLIEDNKENENTQLGELIANNIEKVFPELESTPDKFNNEVESNCMQKFFEQTISSYKSEETKKHLLKIYLMSIFYSLIRQQSTQNE